MFDDTKHTKECMNSHHHIRQIVCCVTFHTWLLLDELRLSENHVINFNMLIWIKLFFNEYKWFCDTDFYSRMIQMFIWLKTTSGTKLSHIGLFPNCDILSKWSLNVSRYIWRFHVMDVIFANKYFAISMSHFTIMDVIKFRYDFVVVVECIYKKCNNKK